jgi:hypothetical protein
MGLFNKEQEEAVNEAVNTAQQSESDDFLEQDAGEGLDEYGEGTISIPYLAITQQTSEAVELGEIEPGHFRNSLTGEDYGTKILAVILGFKICWTERDAAGKTIARYDPYDVEVTGDVYKGMINPKTGNKVQETWLYQLILPEHLDAGFVVFSSSPGNMKYLKGWNTQVKFQRLPSGKPAPRHASVWELQINPDVSKAGKKYFSNKGGIKRVGWISKDLYQDFVLPGKESNQLALAAPPDQPEEVEGEPENQRY